jgi:hypothetical protein
MPGLSFTALPILKKADSELDPDSYANITWDEIKSRLTNEVIKYTEGLL